MSMIDLIPCPYCGGNAGISSADGRYMPHCYTHDCIMEIAPSFPSADEAAAAWNRRAVTRTFALSALIFGLIPIFDIITVCREVIATLKSLWMTFQEKKTS